MIRKNDISTPEGYFEDLQLRLSEIPRREKGSPAGVRRLAPYLALAASVALVVLLGNYILGKTAVSPEDNTWAYVSYLTNALDPDGVELIDPEERDDDGLSDEDIVNYLIADGISVEYLSYLSNEEGY